MLRHLKVGFTIELENHPFELYEKSSNLMLSSPILKAEDEVLESFRFFIQIYDQIRAFEDEQSRFIKFREEFSYFKLANKSGLQRADFILANQDQIQTQAQQEQEDNIFDLEAYNEFIQGNVHFPFRPEHYKLHLQNKHKLVQINLTNPYGGEKTALISRYTRNVSLPLVTICNVNHEGNISGITSLQLREVSYHKLDEFFKGGEFSYLRL